MIRYASKIRWANSLARKESRELLCALTEYVNLGDTQADARFFRKRWPNFFPASFYDTAERDLKSIDGRRFLRIKKVLRDLWTGKDCPPYIAPVLLGLTLGGLDYTVLNDDGKSTSRLYMEWKTGEFEFESNIRFHEAMWLLVRQTWRAKVCTHCSQCFVASRATQYYCSTDCSELAERQLKREWWRKNGNAWRAKRNKESTGKKQGAKGQTGATNLRLM